MARRPPSNYPVWFFFVKAMRPTGLSRSARLEYPHQQTTVVLDRFSIGYNPPCPRPDRLPCAHLRPVAPKGAKGGAPGIAGPWHLGKGSKDPTRSARRKTPRRASLECPEIDRSAVLRVRLRLWHTFVYQHARRVRSAPLFWLPLARLCCSNYPARSKLTAKTHSTVARRPVSQHVA